MKIEFFKYHGTGNDFILLDNRKNLFAVGQGLIARLCHRRYGIGADGLILLGLEAGFDFGMRYFNSDGRESTMCGNGGRCIVAFADFLSLTENNCRFLASDGEHSGKVLRKKGGNYQVKLSMQDVPGYSLRGKDFILNTGSPHLVRFVRDSEETDIVLQGRAIRYHEDFQPSGINVNFVEIQEGQIFVRTYERGVEDETLSCGTGVTASALAYAATMDLKEGNIPVMTRGGALNLHFSRRGEIFTDIWLEGPAVKVFQGFTKI